MNIYTLILTLMTTECSLEGVPPSCVCIRVYSRDSPDQHVLLSAPKGHLHHWPVNHINPQQNVFITVEKVSFVMDNVKNNSIMRGHFLVSGCPTQTQHQNSCKPSCLYVTVCVVFPTMSSPHHSSTFFFWRFILSGT